MRFIIKKLVYFSSFILWILGIFFFTKSYFLNDYLAIEKVNNQKNINNLINIIEKTFDNLVKTANDYAQWDQTYTFIQDKNKAFLYDNFRESSQTLENLNINLMLLSSLKNSTIFSAYYQSTEEKEKFEKYLLKSFVNKSSGFMKFDEKVYFIVKVGITNSDASKDINGYLYLGKVFDNSYLKKLDINLNNLTITDTKKIEDISYLNSAMFISTLNTKIDFDKNNLLNTINIFDINKDAIVSIEAQNLMVFYKKSKNTVMIFSSLLTFLITVIFLLLYRQNEKLKVKIKEKTLALQTTINELSNKNKLIKKTTKMFNTSQQIAHIGTYEYNIKTGNLMWSDEHFRILGKEPNSFKPVLEDFISAVHPEDREYVNNMLKEAILEDKVIGYKYRLLLENKQIKYVQSTSGISKKDIDKNALVMTGNIFDITKIVKKEEELKSKEALLIEQSKMAAMGEMIGNISHQMKQPLNLISTISSSLKLDKEFGTLDDENIDKSMDDIINSTMHLSTTIDDFRNFFDPNKQVVETDVKSILNRAYKLTKAQFSIATIKTDENIENCSLKLYENELLQVILNIFNNSRDELIKTDIYFNRSIFIDSYCSSNTFILKIKDNAGGIKEEIISKVFDAYFTTKRDNKGTGIGLYMSKQIIENNLNGSLEVSNENFEYEGEKYKGACFTIKLPISK